MPSKAPQIGVATAQSEESIAGQFVERMRQPWNEVLLLSPRPPESGPTTHPRISLSMDREAELFDSVQRYMTKRHGDQRLTAEPIEIRIGRNSQHRFPGVVHYGENGFFDLELSDRSYVMIRPPWIQGEAGSGPSVRTELELRDGATGVCEAYRMLNEAIERLHDGQFAADRAALNCFAETALSRTRSMYTFLFGSKNRNYVLASHYIGDLAKALRAIDRAHQNGDPAKMIRSISNRVMHVTFDGASSKHEHFWEPRSLFKVIVDGMAAFLGQLESISAEQSAWFRPTHDYVLARKAYLVPMATGRIEFGMTTTAGAILTTLDRGASKRFREVGRDYYRRDLPPF